MSQAAADTISSEIGQVFGGQPRMLTTFRAVEPGTDGGVTMIGTVAGFFAAVIVAGVGISAMFADWSLRGKWPLISIVSGSAALGLLFDSLLGATLEQKGKLNNDAVNFLSTLSACLFAFAGMAVLATFQAS
jgi:uncharacterized protein (TIGR00297 family)